MRKNQAYNYLDLVHIDNLINISIKSFNKGILYRSIIFV